MYVCMVALSGHCNPPPVYEVLQKVRKNWPAIAVFLGYSEVEVGAIARAPGGDPSRQIQMFLRVWWMPDCGPEKTLELLNQCQFHCYPV